MKRSESGLDNAVWMRYSMKKRLRWLGHVIRMDQQRVPRLDRRCTGRFRSAAYKVQEHSQQELAKDGNHLEGSRGGSSKQIRMTLELGLSPKGSTG